MKIQFQLSLSPGRSVRLRSCELKFRGKIELSQSDRPRNLIFVAGSLSSCGFSHSLLCGKCVLYPKCWDMQMSQRTVEASDLHQSPLTGARFCLHFSSDFRCIAPFRVIVWNAADRLVLKVRNGIGSRLPSSAGSSFSLFRLTLYTFIHSDYVFTI